MFRHFQPTGRGDKRTGGEILILLLPSPPVPTISANRYPGAGTARRFPVARLLLRRSVRVLTANFHAHQRRRQLFRLSSPRTTAENSWWLSCWLSVSPDTVFPESVAACWLALVSARPGQRLFQQASALGGENGFRWNWNPQTRSAS